MTHPAADVELYRIDLDDPRWDARADLLDTGEQARHAAFRTETLRARFRRGRIALRLTLARRLDVEPASIRYRLGPYGKPGLIDGDGLHFNLSHSGGLALIALGPGPLGIDLERRDHAALDPAALLPAIAHPRELAGLPRGGSDTAETFYTLWTRKEAYCKALGQGLNLDPRRVRFERRGEVWQAIEDEDARPWFLAPIEIPGCAAHLCLPWAVAAPPARCGETLLDAAEESGGLVILPPHEIGR